MGYRAKKREHAKKGKLHAYMIAEEQDQAKAKMFCTMDVDERFLLMENKNYEQCYRTMMQGLL